MSVHSKAAGEQQGQQQDQLEKELEDFLNEMDDDDDDYLSEQSDRSEASRTGMSATSGMTSRFR